MAEKIGGKFAENFEEKVVRRMVGGNVPEAFDERAQGPALAPAPAGGLCSIPFQTGLFAADTDELQDEQEQVQEVHIQGQHEGIRLSFRSGRS